MNKTLKQGLRQTRLLPAVALLIVVALLAFDVIAFWGWRLRPLASVDGVEIAIWAVLGGTAAAAGIRWALLDNARMRFQAAASIALMVAFSAVHPWQAGYAADAEMPSQTRKVPAGAVVKYEGGPLTEPEQAEW
jgi:hypothetical protein